MFTHDDGNPEISGFTTVGRLGLFLQGLGGDLSLKKVKNLPNHYKNESVDTGFNWLGDKRIHGRVQLARLYQACIVDHLIVIDSKHWLSLIYDSCDPYPLTAK